MSMPTAVAITAKRAQDELGAAFASSVLAAFPTVALAMLVIVHAENPESRLRPYMDVLPGCGGVGGVLEFKLPDFQRLSSSSTLPSCLNIVKHAARMYTVACEVVGKGVPGLTTAQFTWARFRWAFAIVMSRVVNVRDASGEETSALVPFWDMMNMKHVRCTGGPGCRQANKTELSACVSLTWWLHRRAQRCPRTPKRA